MKISKRLYNGYVFDISVKKNRNFYSNNFLIHNCLWTGKKHYAMLIFDDEGVRYQQPVLKIRGIEVIKSSTPEVCRKSLKEAVQLILTDQDKLTEFVKDFKEKFFKFTPEEVAFPRGVTNISKYESSKTVYKKGTPIHVRATIVYNNYIKQEKLENEFPLIKEGEKVKFIYMSLPNPWHENVVAFIKHLPKEFYQYIDYSTQYYKTFFSVLYNIQKKIISEIQFEKSIKLNELF